MKILFLDIDGVLNSGRSFIAGQIRLKNYVSTDPSGDSDPYYLKITKCTIDSISCEMLNRVLNKFDVKIVLSSTHRKHFSKVADSEKLALIQNYLTVLGVDGDRCIGWTPVLSGCRGDEIKHWIDQNQELGITHIVILDDSSDFLEEQKEFHIHCKGGHGITEQNYRDMTKLLGLEDPTLMFI